MHRNKNDNKLFKKGSSSVKIIKPNATKTFDPTKTISLHRIVHKKKFKCLKWFAYPFLPEGLTILGGKPKSGKSLLTLDLAISIAKGRKYLGKFICQKSTVYYLPFEDNLRRIQDRAKKMVPNGKLPKNLIIPSQLHNFPKLNVGGFACLEKVIKEIPELGVIIIDTYGRFIDKKLLTQQSFQQDYDSLSKLQSLAITNNISILVIHHTTKSSRDDPFDEIIGTMGTQAAPDNLIVMRKIGNERQLFIRTREYSDQTYRLVFKEDRLKFQLKDNAHEIDLSDKALDILDIFKNNPDKSFKQKEIIELTKDERSNVNNKLARLVEKDIILKNGKNNYSLNKKLYEKK